MDRLSGPETADRIVAVVVTYNSDDVIVDCLSSLLDQDLPGLRIIVVDNASTDQTVESVRALFNARNAPLFVSEENASHGPLPPALLIKSGHNRGFAAGCNIGLRVAQGCSDTTLFWLLNPDCRAAPGCAAAYVEAARADPSFALMGGRTLFAGDTQLIQSDGGHLSPWTAVCQNLNQGLRVDTAIPPKADNVNFLSGANLVASRLFLERAGPMNEAYFLYYEEVDWALRRDSLPLRICPEARVFHHGGTSAGSGTYGRAPSAFSNYFNYRNRLRLAFRHCPFALPGAYLYSVLKIAQLALQGARAEAWGAFLGLHQLWPTRAMREKLGPDATRVATGW